MNEDLVRTADNSLEKQILPPVTTRRRCYAAGECLSAQIYAPDGEALGTARFQIESYAGSGFAGQVYRAAVLEGAGMQGEVALKILRPRSKAKNTFRELLFRLSFQTRFAPRLRETAVRTGLIWQAALRAAAEIELGESDAVPRPLGYFWDEASRSYAEIHEWVDGRAPRFTADDEIILRLFSGDIEQPASETQRLRRFMQQVVALCHKVGAHGLARQYEWYSFVAQANVLVRRQRSAGQSEFAAIDWRPGLAVPFFLPLSPAHARIAWQGLRHGLLAHFDQSDPGSLEPYLETHPQASGSLAPLLRRLKLDEPRYRLGIPDLWNHPLDLWRIPQRRWQVKEDLIEDWRRLDLVSHRSATRSRESRAVFLFYLFLDWLPLVGLGLLRLWGNEHHRQHLKLLFTRRAYFKRSLAARKAIDLLEWAAQGRIAPGQQQTFTTAGYLTCKLLLSWLPVRLQRLALDGAERRKLFNRLATHPLRLALNARYRQAWMLELIDGYQRAGLLSVEQAGRLQVQTHERRLNGFARDLGLTLGLEVAAKGLYLGLAAYGVSSGDFLPLGVALLSPIAPSGLVRAAYVGVQLLWELPHILRRSDRKLLFTRLAGLSVAPWRFAGNLFAPLEMFAYYSELSLLLCERLLSEMVAAIPIVGGREKLLAFWLFTLTYNLPLSLKRAVQQGFAPPP